ncbi:2'-5' RNA ligase family protein [Gordonia sp. zg691]|uniref:2'-5' RNA ligase family protein n=1 Tax=Gordonia jinghuaiqii TaxID=2758710 RepID=A0A7D7LPD9_9ACTN|nr:2'-5' RNA ligase family protein [Gordonia jinghuaiqii]MBD0860232.1 2'-5' RNA ligase family protein [Gordonia jinghuaiqii]MCR5977398.1 2'-5' RNA ligase family protein [Gordonia jinghuaiqii]QMT00025.1 2'-5' RNA ligase family protein [Gordonia jinghuaiqii]
MAHSLELLLDEAADQHVRDEWAALAGAGLPHQGSVVSTTNRPHVTLVAASSIDPGVDAALVPAAMTLPISMRLGAPVLFSNRGRVTLSRLVVPSAGLISMHARVTRVADGHIGPDTPESMLAHTRPGRWTPHVTLARRLDGVQLARALEVLDLRAEPTGTFVALRRWDSDAGTDHILAGRAC